MPHQLDVSNLTYVCGDVVVCCSLLRGDTISKLCVCKYLPVPDCLCLLQLQVRGEPFV